MSKLKKVTCEHLSSADFEVKVCEPNIQLIDIETAPNISLIWGHYEQNALHHVQERYVLSYCAKKYNGKAVTKCLPDYEGYVPNKDNDKALITDLWHVFDK